MTEEQHVHGFEAYRTYLAVKLHFTSDTYNFFTYKGAVSVKPETFAKNKDRWRFSKLEKDIGDKADFVEFLIANIVYEKKFPWVGAMFTVKARNNYAQYKKMKNGSTYLFKTHVKKLVDFCDDNNVQFTTLFESIDGNYPALFELLQDDVITIETFLILDCMLNFVGNCNVDDAILWPELVSKWMKYRDFIPYIFNINTMQDIFLAVLEENSIIKQN